MVYCEDFTLPSQHEVGLEISYGVTWFYGILVVIQLWLFRRLSGHATGFYDCLVGCDHEQYGLACDGLQWDSMFLKPTNDEPVHLRAMNGWSPLKRV